MKTCRHIVIAKSVHREIYSSLKMLINSSFTTVGKYYNLIYKVNISCFGNVLINCREEPQCIISSVCRMSCCSDIGFIIRRILMSGIVIKLNKRKSATVINLCRKHKSYLFKSHFRRKMNYTLYILNSISVSVSVSKSAIRERCCSRPDKGHKALICIPGIDHSIESFTWSLNLKMIKLAMPVIL